MNPSDVLKYGHLTVKRTVEGLPEAAWEMGGVCGVWSVKDIIGHLAAYELLLVDVLGPFAGEKKGETPYLSQMGELGPLGFNDMQAEARKHTGYPEVLAEYEAAYACVMELTPKISAEVWRRKGTLPWYGLEYSLEDYIVYSFYGHKREHCAQIEVFKDQNR